jgi:cyclopropane fatty-acyl-phospholipid synthase-like methyltransferase
MHASTLAVRTYYERNSRFFVTFTRAPHTFTIHRSLYPDRKTTLEDALHHSSSLILTQIEQLIQRDELHTLRMVDLGCGVGGTLFHLLARLSVPALAAGLTLSPWQARRASERASQLGLAERCLVIEGDFHHAPLAGGADVVYSVEAFIHAAEPARTLTEAAALLRVGGRLILCDDFLGERALTTATDSTQRWIAAYQQHWHAINLLAPTDLQELAQSAGLRQVSTHSLTPLLRLIVLPDRLAEMVLRIGQTLPGAFSASMVGSMALQQCLHWGLVDYRFWVFEKDG